MIDGAVIFRLHDTHGMPFDYILDELRENRTRFDVLDWMREAINHSWSYDKIMKFLCFPLGDQCLLSFKYAFTRIYLTLTQHNP